jgi:hypothetical protein
LGIHKFPKQKTNIIFSWSHKTYLSFVISSTIRDVSKLPSPGNCLKHYHTINALNPVLVAVRSTALKIEILFKGRILK